MKIVWYAAPPAQAAHAQAVDRRIRFRIDRSIAAGAMVFVSVDELVPLAYEHDWMHHFGIGLVAGITTFMVLLTFF
jgi:hypothetical protein